MDIAPMTKRDKILLYAVLMLAFIVLYVRFLLIPGIGSLQQARADLTEAQDAQITMQETILQAGVNAADKNTAWGELQTANARYYSILTSDELDTLVTGLELNHSMQPVSLSIGQPLTQSMTGYIAGTQAGRAPPPPAALRPPSRRIRWTQPPQAMPCCSSSLPLTLYPTMTSPATSRPPM